MEKSESIKELALALSKCQASIPKIELDREVEVQTKSGYKYKFKYATFANILEKIRKPLAENGLSFIQPINPDGSVTTILMHQSGEWVSSTLLLEAEKSDPQGIGSAITYCKRYSLTAMLGICGDDDDDSNIAEGNIFNFKQEDGTPTKKNVSEKPKGKRLFTRDLVNDKFLQRLHDIESEAIEKGERFSLFTFIESVYDVTPDDVKYICRCLGEYEKEHELKKPTAS